MQNRALRCGPTAMPVAATNMVNGAITSLSGPVGFTMTQPYILLTHIRIVNKGAGAANVSLYIGATAGSAAGTEFAFNGYSVAQNSYVDWYGRVRLEPADFLSGTASVVTTLVFEAEGEIGLV